MKTRLVAWDGTSADFWNSVDNVRSDADTEGDHAVLIEVLDLALWLLEEHTDCPVANEKGPGIQPEPKEESNG